jgi:non-heme chloroperoxidase
MQYTRGVAFITVGRENSTKISLYYEDLGVGPVVVLIPAFPFGGAMWEKQIEPLVHEGHRVITYDRRGFGTSSRPASGYDFDTLASDLNAIVTTLDVRQATLVGASMGAGEVARYFSSYGSTRVIRAVVISPLPPSVVDAGSRLETTLAALAHDRPKFIRDFIAAIVSSGAEAPSFMSSDELRYHWTTAVSASPLAMADCLSGCLTDLRADYASIDVPTLVVAGERDQLLLSSENNGRVCDIVPNCTAVTLAEAPHALFWTHAADLNRLLLEFVDG